MIDVRTAPVHFSELRRMSLSPAHYRAAVEAGRERNPKAAHLRHGLAVDAILFDASPYVVWEGDRRAGKAWDAFAEKHADRLILTSEELQRATAAAHAIYANSDAMRVLRGDRQKSIEWEWLGRKCGSTLDIIKPGSHITELKTARTAHPDRFRFAAIRYAYHAQHRFYGMAAAHAGLGEHEHYTVISESEPPWAVTVMRYTARALEAGERMLRMWMERLNSCIESNEWPAYAQSIIDLDVDDDNELIFDDEASEAAQ